MRVSSFLAMSSVLLTTAFAAGCSSPGGDNAGGVAAADVVLTAAATTDYGSVTIGSSVDKMFTVVNQGAGDATLAAITTAGLGLSAPFTLDGSTCQTGQVLQGGQNESCTITVKFAPTAAIKTYTDIVVQYTDQTQTEAQSNPTQWELIGTGVPKPIPAAHVTITSNMNPSFGSVAVSNSAQISFTVLNDGTADATLGQISSPAIGLTAPFSLSGGTCQTGQVLLAGQSQSCTLIVTFAPTAVVSSTASMSVQYVDGNSGATQTSANTVTLQGAGVLDCVNFPQPSCPQPQPSLSYSDGATFNYGNVAIANTEDHTFTLANKGAGAATLGSIDAATLGLSAPYTIVGGTCATGAIVAAKTGTCTVIVRYTPTAQAASPETMTVAYDGGGGPMTAPIAITGTGILDCYDYQAPACPPPAPALTISGQPSFDFGSWAIGNSSTQTLTVTNGGNANGTLGDMSAAGLGLTAPFTVASGGSCATGSVLTAKGGSCTVNVTFTPIMAAPSTSTFTVSYSGPSSTGLTATLTLQATGVIDCFNFYQPGLNCPLPTPNLTISNEPGFDFGSVAIGNYQQHTFTVTNAGNLAGTLGDLSTAGLGLTAPFSVVGGGTCATGGSIAAKGGTCTFVMQFTPSAQIVSAQTATLSYSGGPTAQTVTVGASGTGVLDCFNYFQPQCPPPPPIFVFGAASASFGNVPVETSATVSVTVYNQGHGDGTLGDLSTAGLGVTAPFSVVGGSCVTGGVIPQRGGSCTLTLQVSPNSTGDVSSTLTLQYTGPSGAISPIALGLYASGVLDCTVSALSPAFQQGVGDAQSINSSQAAQGTADGSAASYQTGYNNGYTASYQSDYNADYNQTYSVAYTSAYNAAYNSASSSGCSDATNVGGSDGRSVGASDGQSDGYNAGYADGHATGYTDGYNAGYSDGQDNCPPPPAGGGGGGGGGGGSYGGGGGGGGGSYGGGGGSYGGGGGGSTGSTGGGSTGSNGSDGSYGYAQPRPVARDSFSDPNQESCYQQGYGATLNPSAYQNAFNAASTSGPSYNSGYSNGQSVASSDAANAGNPAGTAAGQAAGTNDGKGPGYTAGYNSCYQNAYNAGYNSQYSSSYNAYYPSGSSAGYNDGYSSGESAGYSAGYGACPYANVMPRALTQQNSTHANAGIALALTRPSYGAGLPWVKSGPNGVKLDVYVTPPIRHGRKTRPILRTDARQRMNQMVRPRLRYQARKLQVAALPK